MAQESQNVITQSYSDDATKDEVVWQNLQEEVYDSAGISMNDGRKERFYRKANEQETVREFYITSDTEMETKDSRRSYVDVGEHNRQRQQRTGEAVRDTMFLYNDLDSYGDLGPYLGSGLMDYCYEIVDPDAGVGIEPADVGLEMPNHFDPYTTAKITMFGEEKHVNEPGIDPEELGETYARVLHEAQRDPWLDRYRELSEDYKREHGLQKTYSRGRG